MTEIGSMRSPIKMLIELRGRAAIAERQASNKKHANGRMKEGAVEAEILDWTESLTECGRGQRADYRWQHENRVAALPQSGLIDRYRSRAGGWVKICRCEAVRKICG
jgi:hypothetical protein